MDTMVSSRAGMSDAEWQARCDLAALYRITELYDYEKFTAPAKIGGRYFYTRNDGLQNQYVLYVQDKLGGESRMLIDPNAWSKDGTVALSGVAVSEDARSVAYSASISGMYLATEVFPRLGIDDEMRAKSKKIDRERVGAVVARGEAEIGFQQISELLPVSGIDYVGPLPADIQRTTVSYQIWRLKDRLVLEESEETHRMRYFFAQELKLFLEITGFELLRLGSFPAFEQEPSETSWSAMLVARAI